MKWPLIPDLGMVIDAVELDRDEVVRCRRVEAEMFPVPAMPPGEKPVPLA